MKAENKPIELKDQTTEQLALLMQEQYQIIFQCNQNLQAINNEINARIAKQREEKNDGKGT